MRLRSYERSLSSKHSLENRGCFVQGQHQQEAQTTPIHHSSRAQIVLLQPLPTRGQPQGRRVSALLTTRQPTLPRNLGKAAAGCLKWPSFFSLTKKPSISIAARVLSITVGTC